MAVTSWGGAPLEPPAVREEGDVGPAQVHPHVGGALDAVGQHLQQLGNVLQRQAAHHHVNWGERGACELGGKGGM